MKTRTSHRAPRAFTLLELLAVIAIIGVLAGMILAATGAAQAASKKKRVKGELAKLKLYIDQYESRKGFYPPDNPNSFGENQLFYELSGTIKTNGLPGIGNGFVTVNGSYSIAAAGPNSVLTKFGVEGFLNSSQGPGGIAGSFLPSVHANDIRNIGTTNRPVWVLAVPVKGPDEFLDANGEQANLWNYNHTNPTNNPNSYDLWADILIGKNTFRISNWSEDPIKLQP